MQKKSKQHTVKAEHKSLSIQFSLDGFSFCITDDASNEVITFTHYTFDESLATPELLLGKVLMIFGQDTDLHQDFSSVTAIHQNQLATLVPTPFFEEDKLKNYLDYTVKTLDNDYVTYDTLTHINAKNVYIPFVNINNYLFRNFGEFEFKHHSTVLIDKLISYSKNTPEKQFFVMVSATYIDIVVTKEQQLLFYNSFSFETKEDFIYYILFTAEQLQLNTEEFPLTFIGDIDTDSELYQIAYQYIRNISFIQPTTPFFEDSHDFLNHSNYIIVP